MAAPTPAYLESLKTGLLEEKAAAARQQMQHCNLCPRRCGVNRLAGETGFCRTADRAWVSSFAPHFGEEAPLVGKGGSGTIFFTHCNLLCLFCQNFDISHGGKGEPVEDASLAEMMLQLQKAGCHNINFVTPSHVVPQILSAAALAAAKGLQVPLVYNSGGYDRVETLKLLEGVVDIYMPDFKFWDPDIAEQACQAGDYPNVARRALIEMHRQVGDLQIGNDGIAYRGVLLRHLVLPGRRAGTSKIMEFVAQQVSANTYVNVMPQYRPCGRAGQIEGLEKKPTDADIEEALAATRKAGISRIDPSRRVFMLW
ncbi:MAG: radical SAM protein [Desulfobacterales bacterium]|nr:radical SAM protein [Desulfobacterales bacterium]